MTNDEAEVLFSLAQVAVAFAGFSAIVVLFGRGESGRWRVTQADQFHGMVLHAMVAVLFCLLPLVVGVFTLDRAQIWNVCSALLGAEIVIHVTAVLLLTTTVGLQRRLLISIGYVFAAVQFMNVAGMVFDHEFRAYVVGVVWHVLMSGLLFVVLIWVPNAHVDTE